MKIGASGSDFVTVRTLKYIFPVISGHLVYLFNEYFRTEVLPSWFKITKVISVYKGGDKNVLENYRPISLLPVVSRLFEKLIVKRMVEFLESKSFFNPNQFCFWRGLSTEHAVLFLTSFVSDVLDNGMKVASVFF